MSEETMVSDQTFGELTKGQRAMLQEAHHSALRVVERWNQTLRSAGVPIRLAENIGVTPVDPPPEPTPPPSPPAATEPAFSGSVCPECGHPMMVPAGTCEKCLNCGAAGECG
jgi:hypothetical protein